MIGMKPHQVAALDQDGVDYRLHHPVHHVVKLPRREGNTQDVDTDGRDEVPPSNHIEISEI